MLIVSLSARALAEAACRAGYRVDAVDCFADTDTAACTRALWRVDGGAGGFDLASLQGRIGQLGKDRDDLTLVIGSGLEHGADILPALTDGWHVLGNTATCLGNLSDWRGFFALLDRLGIPYPSVTTERAGSGWLRKSGMGAGGWRVHHAEVSERSLAADEYYQRWQSGRVLSVVFLGDGREARIVGFSEQFQASIGACPWVYAGAVSLPAETHDWASTVAGWVRRLTAACGLRGLCGLDFILDPEGRPWLLEVNPRPPASFELHDPPGTALFAAHVRACEGRLARLASRPTAPCYAHAVLYATQAVTIPADFHWPGWAADLPAGGTTIRQGQPICSVRAQGDEPGLAVDAVLRRRQQLETGLHATV